MLCQCFTFGRKESNSSPFVAAAFYAMSTNPEKKVETQRNKQLIKLLLGHCRSRTRLVKGENISLMSQAGFGS